MAASKAKESTKVMDSERIEVIVERKYSEQKNRVFASTTIIKGGKTVLESFKIPVDKKVSLPIEIIRVLRDRKISRIIDKADKFVPEFNINRASDSF